MQIFIMRHGEAANIEGEDSLRPLTEQGMLETEKMGLWLARRNPALMNVFVSPYLRAQQSCANVAKVLQESCLLNGIIPEILNFITPSGSAAQVHDFIDGLFHESDSLIENIHSDESNSDESNSDEDKAILIVSHMPFVSYLVGELTGSMNTPIFSTGAIAIIDYDIKQMQGQLVSMVSPAKVHI